MGFEVGVDVRFQDGGWSQVSGLGWSRVLGRKSGSCFRMEIGVRVGVGFRDGVEVGFQDWVSGSGFGIGSDFGIGWVGFR